MRVGFTLDFRNPMRRPWREHWDDLLWLFEQAEQLGFDYVLVQEHFFTPDGYGPSVPAFLALLAERTRTARIGTNSYILPLHNPAMLAQETAVLDQLSGGRLEVTVGLGHRAAEYQAAGVKLSDRRSLMEESLTILRRAWTEDRVSFHGRHFDFDDLEIQPKPAQSPHPPLWVAATVPAAAGRAGRHGAHLRGASVEEAFFAAYREGRAEAGLDPAGGRISKSWAFTATPTDPEVMWRRYRDLYFERWDFYQRIRGEIGIPALNPGLPAANADTYRNHELIGDPSHILEVLDKVARPLPLTDVIFSGPCAGIPVRGDAYDSVALFAEEVMPELKTW
jgi:alkanesulfonate monooxygenase SsuD/methylene tetrahydromethanopterin reductase-like flavin-dependent oxidoreductase (luciferase family)